ncbi:MAG: hypothetical protein U0904_04620 [Candidatus Nanopelagicales bacterium]|nr:hypothetical protein [Candidatus Nanopelagicales bacterium]
MSVQPGPFGGSTTDGGDPYTGMLLKIVIVVVAITTAAALVWGIVVTMNYSDYRATSEAQIASLQEQLGGESGRIAEDEAKMAEAREEFARVKSTLKTEKVDLKSEDKQLTQLRADYDKAQRKAAADEKSLEAQEAAAQAKAKLASHCAAVVVGSMEHLYNQLDIMSPEPVTFKEVATYLKKASVPCQGVVKIVD